MQVPDRSSSQTIQAKGIYPGAKVVRGPDWEEKYNEQDGKIRFLYTIKQVSVYIYIIKSSERAMYIYSRVWREFPCRGW